MTGAGLQVWSKPLQSNGARAVALLNRSAAASEYHRRLEQSRSASRDSNGPGPVGTCRSRLLHDELYGTCPGSWRRHAEGCSRASSHTHTHTDTASRYHQQAVSPSPRATYSDSVDTHRSARKQNAVSYSWIWGPAPFTAAVSEPYAQSPGQTRVVQYFDKSRMEINQPEAPRGAYYVTNGRLTDELITGLQQIGDAQYEQHTPAALAMAGDPQNTFPLYRDLQKVYRRQRATDHANEFIYRGPDGSLQIQPFPNANTDPSMAIVQHVAGLGIPQIFWQFMNQPGSVLENGQVVTANPLYDWQYVVGEPLTEAYWTMVNVNGVNQGVLVQAFERRVLTYTPTNSPAFQVEMGNIGRHYFEWRYGVRPQ